MVVIYPKKKETTLWMQIILPQAKTSALGRSTKKMRSVPDRDQTKNETCGLMITLRSFFEMVAVQNCLGLKKNKFMNGWPFWVLNFFFTGIINVFLANYDTLFLVNKPVEFYTVVIVVV